MKRNNKLPIEFDNWIEFNDFIQSSEVLLYHQGKEKLEFRAILPTGEIKDYKLTKTYIHARCWEEIESLRMGIKTTNKMLSALRYGCGTSHVREYQQARELLFKIINVKT
jgi:hypothetical protein